ncbi:aminotransferase-like domain-containing protein [Williamsia muralis]|uniref:GntR family transcriptional regulator n=1 Tax=Williamsia marianensis TaxID=85044 RepID=A0A2G3PGV5_WILMA|nr:PLP-dependent aminotransferase family protein [Williamsia marianensis]PHV65020.1 GntR family transcriptional regulator [Williamsia marianensis]PZU01048.1 MAG: PLP-dependent aminotransferase family protein [Gordonia sp. (in: high G+C Gram-positive bacteria)]
MYNDSGVSVLTESLRALITQSTPGTRLPSVRSLQEQHRVSPNSVQRVLRDLATEGLVDVRPGAGSFVAAAAPPRSPADTSWQESVLGARMPPELSRTLDLWRVPGSEVVRLKGGYLDDELLPHAALDAAMTRAIKRSRSWGRYPIEGSPELRRWFASEIDGIHASEVIVTAGGQTALSVAVRALIRPGESVIVESPTYTGLIAIVRSHGAEVIPVPMDSKGIRTDLLADAISRTGSRLLVVQPAFANPSGVTLAGERRRQIIELAEQHSLFVIEDDYARYLGIDGDPPPPLTAQDPNGHVVHIRSLTKPVGPGMRVAALCARGPALARLRAAKMLDDFYVAGPVQEAAVEFLNSPAWPRHNRQVRRALGERRDALLGSLGRLIPQIEVAAVPRGGMHLWVRLPDGLDDRDVAAAAHAEGVMVGEGTPWFPAESDHSHLRLTFGETPVPVIGEAVSRLARVFR